MSAAYVVLIGSEEKHGALCPTILGPFPSEAAAEEWMVSGHQPGLRESLARWLDDERTLFGGYPAIHLIGSSDVEDPMEWEQEYQVS